MNVVLHIAHDRSVIAQVMSDMFRIPVYQGWESTKTMCGKRTRTSNVRDMANATCEACHEAASLEDKQNDDAMMGIAQWLMANPQHQSADMMKGFAPYLARLE